MRTDEITDIDVVTHPDRVREAFAEEHDQAVQDMPSMDSRHFEGGLRTYLHPRLIGTWADLPETRAYNQATAYFDSLIPWKPDEWEAVKIQQRRTDESGKPVLDENGNEVYDEVPKLGKDGKPIQKKLPPSKMFYISVDGYKSIQTAIKTYHAPYAALFKARKFAESACAATDETKFDRYNDFLWRHVMAVDCPEACKNEFRHWTINAKRRLYYLGDRNELENQTAFGLWDDCLTGGTGKTTLMEAAAMAYSDGHEWTIKNVNEYFKFNRKSFDRYGVLFWDENEPVDKKVCEQVKMAMDAGTRPIEAKGKDGIDVPNVLSWCICANHDIAAYLFGSEARGQRRNSFFRVKGNVVQYKAKTMRKFFDRVFQICPLEESCGYQHSNPHMMELGDREATILEKIAAKVASAPVGGGLQSSFGPGGGLLSRFLSDGLSLGMVAELLEIEPKTDLFYGLRDLLGMAKKGDTTFFNHQKGRSNMHYYSVKREQILQFLSAPRTDSQSSGFCWTREWRDSRPWLDVEKAIEYLETSDGHDCTSPITYDEYRADAPQTLRPWESNEPMNGGNGK